MACNVWMWRKNKGTEGKMQADVADLVLAGIGREDLDDYHLSRMGERRVASPTEVR